jgi:hypothetical protein
MPPVEAGQIRANPRPLSALICPRPASYARWGRSRTQKCPGFLRESQQPGALFAEGKRFELLVRGHRTLVFKTSSIGRSDNLP